MFSLIKRWSLNLICLQLKAFFDDKLTLLMQNAVIFLIRRLSAVEQNLLSYTTQLIRNHARCEYVFCMLHFPEITLVGWLLRRHHLVFEKRLHFTISDDGFQNFENCGSTRSWKLSNRDFWQNRKHHLPPPPLPPGGPFCFVK